MASAASAGVPRKIAERAVKLRAALEEHNYRYYALDDPEIGDDAYDALLDELRDLEARYPQLVTPDSPTQRVGGEPVGRLEKVRHPEPMLSLGNVRSEEELRAWVERIEEVPLPERTLVNVNVPAGQPSGVEVTSLGKRIYRDELKLEGEEEHRRRYWIYGSDPGFHDEPGTDLAAVAAGRIAVTPIHFDLTHRPSLELLRRFDLNELFLPLAPDAR